MSNILLVVAPVAAALLACLDPGSANVADVEVGGPSDVEAAVEVEVAPEERVSGRIGAVDFAASSGLFHDYGDGVYLAFMGEGDACAAFTERRISAGVTQVQLWIAEAPTVSTYINVEAWAATVGSDCPTGDYVDEEMLAHLTSSVVGTVTFTRVSAHELVGTLSVEFEDGSHLEGPFSVASCAGPSDGEDGAFCR